MFTLYISVTTFHVFVVIFDLHVVIFNAYDAWNQLVFASEDFELLRMLDEVMPSKKNGAPRSLVEARTSTVKAAEDGSCAVPLLPKDALKTWQIIKKGSAHPPTP